MTLHRMKAVSARKCYRLILLLSSKERCNNDWLQTSAREIQIRIKAQDFNGLVIICKTTKLPRKAGSCGGFRSSPATSLREILQIKQLIKRVGEILWLRTSGKGFCRQWENHCHWFCSLSEWWVGVNEAAAPTVWQDFLHSATKQYALQENQSHTLEN